jgi:hypothetical protein
MKKAGFVCSIIVVLFALGCGAATTLVSMSITPTAAGVIGLGDTIPVQLKAYGNFIHPTETRDISTQVTWTSNTPAVATVDNTGLVTPTGIACGGTLITATAGKNLIGRSTADSQAEMTATATFTVYSTVAGCPTPPSSMVGRSEQ